jgi:peptide/nickel transport system substrate-binding protein
MLSYAHLARFPEVVQMRVVPILACAVLAAALALSGPATAQDKPRTGGELIFVVPAEPPSFDAHREETFGMLHPGRRTTAR